MVRPFTLESAAREGFLIRVRCRGCSRSTLFLASDLLQLFPARLDIGRLPFRCTHCRTRDVIMRAVLLDDRERPFEIMRPVGRKTITIWRAVRMK